MPSILEFQPQQTPKDVQRVLHDWSQAVALWNTYRASRLSGMGHWRALTKLSEAQGVTNKAIIHRLNRIQHQILLEHPELTPENGGDDA